jgi:hypothetical protein
MNQQHKLETTIDISTQDLTELNENGDISSQKQTQQDESDIVLESSQPLYDDEEQNILKQDARSKKVTFNDDAQVEYLEKDLDTTEEENEPNSNNEQDPVPLTQSKCTKRLFSGIGNTENEERKTKRLQINVDIPEDFKVSESPELCPLQSEVFLSHLKENTIDTYDMEELDNLQGNYQQVMNQKRSAIIKKKIESIWKDYAQVGKNLYFSKTKKNMWDIQTEMSVTLYSNKSPVKFIILNYESQILDQGRFIKFLIKVDGYSFISLIVSLDDGKKVVSVEPTQIPMLNKENMILEDAIKKIQSKLDLNSDLQETLDLIVSSFSDHQLIYLSRVQKGWTEEDTFKAKINHFYKYVEKEVQPNQFSYDNREIDMFLKFKK